MVLARLVSIAGLVAVAALALSPASARACSDAGPPNQVCSDGGTAWTLCDVHGDCPSGQLCGPQGACICGSSCTEPCTGEGCHCCGTPTDGGSCFVRFVCEAETDAGGRSPMDGGAGAAPDAMGCSIGGRDDGGGRALAALAALTVLTVLVARRRSRP